MPSLEGFVGKPIVVYKDNKRREVGTVIRAYTEHDHIHVEASVSDPALRRTLGFRLHEIQGKTANGKVTTSP